MWSIGYVTLFIVLLLVLSAIVRVTYEPTASLFHPVYFSTVLFCSINSLIANWELSLWWYREKAEKLYDGYKKKLKRGELPSPMFLFTEASLSEVLGYEYWANVWGTYALMDTSYIRAGSFGYNIDVGNGWTTLLPALAMIWVASGGPFSSFASPRLMGFLLGLSMWQQLYGTLIYFLQYVNNKRWEEHGTKVSHMVGLVGGSNFIWIVGPGLCLWACWQMVATDSIQVFL
eukprot:TRINITY_DN14410_c0_g1_i1.p1 TRINITY_DN14410_c0_g1~~TRINITY_DN14410_c0_g1_i1.p1  ORF type:complete len:231 (+),score=45.22 TRINITY_DN14410_c0_g1_i1:55-747(+)